VAYLNLGDTLSVLGDTPGAAVACRRYLAMVPDTPVGDRLEAALQR